MCYIGIISGFLKKPVFLHIALDFWKCLSFTKNRQESRINQVNVMDPNESVIIFLIIYSEDI